MIDILLNPGMQPFMVAYGLVIGLFAVEMVLFLAGTGGMIIGTDGADLDFDTNVDSAIEVRGSVDSSEPSGVADHHSGGILGWLGLSEMPTGVWLVALATSFGTIGYALQLVLWQAAGFMLSPGLAVLAAVGPAVLSTRWFGRRLNRLIPRFETAAISERSYGRRRGVVTVGVARAGSPARVRFTDGHGGTHYLMAEPLDRNDEIREGAEVSILKKRDGTFALVQVSD